MINPSQIRVSRLFVHYDGVEVIHGVDFTIHQGEFVTIVGKSGCGKSTLIHALAGFIERNGAVDIPEKLGVVFQNYAVFPWLTVKGNIAFGLRGIDPASRNHIIHSVLEMTGLSLDAKKYPAQLSGGQTQRVALGRAIAAAPDALLMDEPFGALDMYTREKMQAWLLEILDQQRTTVLFITHNVEEAIFLSDRVLIMGPGQIVAEFRVSFTRPRTDEIKFTPAFVELKKRIIDTMEVLNN